MKNSGNTPGHVVAGGGIVVRDDVVPPRIALVRLRKDDSWVLPKGKLKAGEDVRAAAEREVLEETGHAVSVHEFLGSLSHMAGERHKVVHFWRMRALDAPGRALTPDVKGMKWLPLKRAIAKLSRDHEKFFLAQVGPAAIEAAQQAARAAAVSPLPDAAAAPLSGKEFFAARIWGWLRRLMRLRGGIARANS